MNDAAPTQNELDREVERRRTFAIISHPDAGKTTLTEKMLLYSGAIHLAGSVKAKRAARHAVSDWMEMEKERGISITSSVLQFPYSDYAINLLDTPGHADFSEDTYRTLSAADSAIMLLDCAKGIELQTEKLFKVCRMRHLPIFTFINKMDRYGRSPLDLMEEIEDVLGIETCAVNWPIGRGKDFSGVYDLQSSEVLLFSDDDRHGEAILDVERTTLDDPKLENILGPTQYESFREEVELLEIAGEPLDVEKVRAGELTPVYFGSALTNYGVEPFMDSFFDMAPSPKHIDDAPVEPTRSEFSGFVFKIQANMNPNHRDRVAFMRVTSGKYERGMHAKLGRNDKEIKLSYPQQFMAQDREMAEEAYAGDVIGLYDPGYFKIGDTVSTGEPVEARQIPRFSPEHFAQVELKQVLERKKLVKGLDQLSEEGAIQVFRRPRMGHKDPIVGAVGILQFEVLKHRLETEYNVEVNLRQLNYSYARWVDEDEFDPKPFNRHDYTLVLEDSEERTIVLFRNDWALNYCKRQYPDVDLYPNPPGTPGIQELHGTGWDF